MNSNIVDWILIGITVVISLSLVHVNPDSSNFSLLDLSISNNHREQQKVPLWLLIILAVIAPAAVIGFTSLRIRAPDRASRLSILRRGLKGFGISISLATVVLNIKNLAGKPRPDFLAICQPDIDHVEFYTVGGYGQAVSPLWVRVYREICKQPDDGFLNDAFRSFPCGSATVSFAGLWYLTLWISHIFQIPPFARKRHNVLVDGQDEDGQARELLHEGVTEPLVDNHRSSGNGGGLPAYYLFMPFLPLGLAIFISGTRYFDFRNHGVDVVAGALAGMGVAYVAFEFCSPTK